MRSNSYEISRYMEKPLKGIFLDPRGNPIEVGADNRDEVYPCTLHGIMLLTSVDREPYIPPDWSGTVYSTSELLHTYRRKYNIDFTRLTLQALVPYDPVKICCEYLTLEITVLPVDRNIFRNPKYVAFCLKQEHLNVVVIKELALNIGTNIFPIYNTYFSEIMREGVHLVYVDGAVFSNASRDEHYHRSNGSDRQRVYELIRILGPYDVRSLCDKKLPSSLYHLCTLGTDVMTKIELN